MHGRSLFDVVREYFVDPERFAAGLLHPVLLWRVGGPAGDPIIAPTHTHGGRGGKDLPTAGDPVVFSLKKGTQSAFAFGVTLGRTENNDVVLRHQEVSRFHAYVQMDKGRHLLADADSKNGTFLDGVRLAANHATPLPPACKVALGELQLEYFEPGAFCEMLRRGSP
jgi:hypothetical protein